MSEHRTEDLRRILPELHPADIADAMTDLEPSMRSALFRMLDRENALDVFEQLDEAVQASLLETLSKEQVAAVVPNLSPDDQADLMDALPDAVAERMLALLPPKARAEVKRLMSYPEDSAGALMTTEFATLPPDITVQEAISRLREMAPRKETIYYSYVIDRVGRLIGRASLEDLVLAPAGQKVSDIMYPGVHSVVVDQDGEEVVKAIQKYDLVAIPVVNRAGILVGMVTVDDVMDFLEDEQTEDMYHFGAAGKPVHRYLDLNFFKISRQRAVWLAGLVLFGMVSATFLKNFGAFLRETLALAFFMPMLMASAGNAGTQAAAVITRNLAMGELDTSGLFKVWRKELSIGLMTGTLLGCLAFCIATIMQHDPVVGAVVGFSMAVAVTTTTSMGGLVPLLFNRIHIDPALVSGPAIASVSDIITLAIYLTIASSVLGP